MDSQRKAGTVASVSSYMFTLYILVTLVQIAAAGGYRSRCSTHGDCDSGLICLDKKTCGCFTYKKDSIKVFYDDDLKLCFGYVSKLCTLSTDDGLPQINCVPNADCSVPRWQPPGSIFGTCECKRGYQSVNDGKSCVSETELRTGKNIHSMDQMKPEGWNRGKSSSSAIRPPFEVFNLAAVSTLIILLRILPFR